MKYDYTNIRKKTICTKLYGLVLMSIQAQKMKNIYTANQQKVCSQHYLSAVKAKHTVLIPIHYTLYHSAKMQKI